MRPGNHLEEQAHLLAVCYCSLQGLGTIKSEIKQYEGNFSILPVVESLS